MAFEDEEKKARAKRLVKIMGISMAISFMILAAFLDNIGGFIGFSPSMPNYNLVRGIFFTIGVTDLIVFTFIFK